MEKIRLVNGLRVGNLSSPHPFTFDDGSILGAVSPDDSREFSASPVEIKTDRGGWTDVRLTFELNTELRAEIERVNADEGVDIVLVSLPTMTAIKAAGLPIGKCRVVRLTDRVNKLVSSTEFCV